MRRERLAARQASSCFRGRPGIVTLDGGMRIPLTYPDSVDVDETAGLELDAAFRAAVEAAVKAEVARLVAAMLAELGDDTLAGPETVALLRAIAEWLRQQSVPPSLAQAAAGVTRTQMRGSTVAPPSLARGGGCGRPAGADAGAGCGRLRPVGSADASPPRAGKIPGAALVASQHSRARACPCPTRRRS